VSCRHDTRHNDVPRRAAVPTVSCQTVLWARPSAHDTTHGPFTRHAARAAHGPRCTRASSAGGRGRRGSAPRRSCCWPSPAPPSLLGCTPPCRSGRGWAHRGERWVVTAGIRGAAAPTHESHPCRAPPRTRGRGEERPTPLCSTGRQSHPRRRRSSRGGGTAWQGGGDAVACGERRGGEAEEMW
jgi:hypothetical protein